MSMRIGAAANVDWSCMKKEVNPPTAFGKKIEECQENSADASSTQCCDSGAVKPVPKKEETCEFQNC